MQVKKLSNENDYAHMKKYSSQMTFFYNNFLNFVASLLTSGGHDKGNVWFFQLVNFDNLPVKDGMTRTFFLCMYCMGFLEVPYNNA